MATRKDWIEKEIARSREKAVARGTADMLRTPSAVAARYSKTHKSIRIELSNGAAFEFPAALAEGLADAPVKALEKIDLTPAGSGLHWPALDVDLSVEKLLAGVFGSKSWMTQLAKQGGASKPTDKGTAVLIDEALKGLDDVAAGRVESARPALLKIKHRLKPLVRAADSASK